MLCKSIIEIPLLLLFHGMLNACSVFCDFPTKLDNKTFVGEGVVIGYIGNHTHKDIEGEYGIIKVAITKIYHPNIKVDTIFISKFGLGAGCETTGFSIDVLKRRYPLDQTISFIGKKTGYFKDSILHIAAGTCEDIYLGSMETRLSYNYETLRESSTLNKMLDLNLYLMKPDIFLKNEKWDWQELEKIADVSERLAKTIIVPELFQIYLDIIELSSTKSRDVRFYILKRMVWSHYIINKEFFTKQNITKKQKEELLKDFNAINGT